MSQPKEKKDVLQGTLALMVLKTLETLGPLHGYGIAQMLKDTSGDVLRVGESSLYPALQRLLLNGWAKSDWGASENNRRAKFYRRTKAGERQLGIETQEWATIARAIGSALKAT